MPLQFETKIVFNKVSRDKKAYWVTFLSHTKMRQFCKLAFVFFKNSFDANKICELFPNTAALLPPFTKSLSKYVKLHLCASQNRSNLEFRAFLVSHGLNASLNCSILFYYKETY